jgi:hypothetical protein
MFHLGYLAVVRLRKRTNRTLLILQLMLLAVATIGCESLVDDLTHRNESPYDSFIRHSDEEQQRREHPEWQQ